jgi:nicotinamidase-related amidase/isocitrate/isopropylmalate dehydrogenase
MTSVRAESPDDPRPLTIGLAVGEGTGVELANVFERVVSRFAQLYSVTLTIERSPRLYHSYHSLISERSVGRVSQLTHEDAAHYENYCRTLAAQQVSAVFRTAMNAQSLYLVRQALQSVKIERLCGESTDLLLVRDQAQGFYTGDNAYGPAEGIISRTCNFSKQLTAAIVAFAIDQARQQWGPDGIDRIIMAYKFHLLDGLFSAWVEEWSQEYGVNIEICQPDTVNRNLLHDGLKGHVLIIGANEWADIMHSVLLELLHLGPQENRFSRNVYLDPALQGLVEYQTVHGSADNIAGKGLVNPFATMRAAACIMERHAACHGAELLMANALLRLEGQHIVTPDLGGRCSTDTVVASLLDLLAVQQPQHSNANNPPLAQRIEPPSTGNHRSTGKRTALLVMDLQNDFCSPDGVRAGYRDLSRMIAPAERIPVVIEFARRRGIEVIFVQFIGDEKYQKPNWKDRDLAAQKQPKCCENSWGAEFYNVSPQPGERVFRKYAHFDAFLSPDFEAYLREQQLEHLVFVGFYSDVCLDSTARTAFQKGYYLTVIADCTTSLHHDDELTLNFMRNVYGATIVSHTQFMTNPTDRES